MDHSKDYTAAPRRKFLGRFAVPVNNKNTTRGKFSPPLQYGHNSNGSTVNKPNAVTLSTKLDSTFGDSFCNDDILDGVCEIEAQYGVSTRKRQSSALFSVDSPEQGKKFGKRRNNQSKCFTETGLSPEDRETEASKKKNGFKGSFTSSTAQDKENTLGIPIGADTLEAIDALDLDEEEFPDEVTSPSNQVEKAPSVRHMSDSGGGGISDSIFLNITSCMENVSVRRSQRIRVKNETEKGKVKFFSGTVNDKETEPGHTLKANGESVTPTRGRTKSKDQKGPHTPKNNPRDNGPCSKRKSEERLTNIDSCEEKRNSHDQQMEFSDSKEKSQGHSVNNKRKERYVNDGSNVPSTSLQSPNHKKSDSTKYTLRSGKLEENKNIKEMGLLPVDKEEVIVEVRKSSRHSPDKDLESVKQSKDKYVNSRKNDEREAYVESGDTIKRQSPVRSHVSVSADKMDIPAYPPCQSPTRPDIRYSSPSSAGERENKKESFRKQQSSDSHVLQTTPKPETALRSPFSDSRNAMSFISTQEKMELTSWGLPEVVLERYLKNGIQTMFQWQAECLSLPEVLNGKNLVYSAPTSAGKTLVAELLLLKRVIESGRKGVFILPFVSVAREKMYYLQKMFGAAGVRVEGFMGSQGPPGGLRATDIAVCTIEKANNLVNRLLEDKRISELGIIVVDELHMLADSHRGYLLELLLTKIMFVSSSAKINTQAKEVSSIQIVGMSATLPNLDLLSCWLNSQLYSTDFRPIPLKQMVKINKSVYDSNMTKIRDLDPLLTVKGDSDHLIQLCLETVLQGLSVLVFCPTKAWCEKLAEAVAREFFSIGKPDSQYPPEVSSSLRESLDSEGIARVMQALRKCPVGLDKVLARSISFGAAFHHAGLTFDERDIIEGGFRTGSIRVLVATSTLSSGVNLPARRVIIRSPVFGGKILDTQTYRQMIGRAGRKGVDTEGESILICRDGEQQKAQTLMTSSLPPVTSCLQQDSSLTSSMKRAILEVIVSGIATTPKEVEHYSKSTLLAASLLKEMTPSQADAQNTILSCVEFLEENEFIRLQDVDGSIRYISTQLGCAVLSSGLSPDEGLHVFSELYRARKCFVLENELHIIYQVTPVYVSSAWPNMDWLTFLSIWESLSEDMKRVAELVGVEESFIVRAMKGTVNRKVRRQAKQLAVHQRFYTALALHELVQEVPLNTVARKYGATRGMLQSLQQSAATFAGMVTVFCNRLGWHNMELLIAQFQDRLHFGIQRELCDLVRLTHLNGQRARDLYNAGLETVSMVAHATPQDVENILRSSTPFQSHKMGEEDHRKGGTIWLSSGQPLTEAQAALLIVKEARELVQKELGITTIDWTQRTEALTTPNRNIPLPRTGSTSAKRFSISSVSPNLILRSESIRGRDTLTSKIVESGLDDAVTPLKRSNRKRISPAARNLRRKSKSPRFDTSFNRSTKKRLSSDLIVQKNLSIQTSEAVINDVAKGDNPANPNCEEHKNIFDTNHQQNANVENVSKQIVPNENIKKSLEKETSDFLLNKNYTSESLKDVQTTNTKEIGWELHKNDFQTTESNKEEEEPIKNNFQAKDLKGQGGDLCGKDVQTLEPNVKGGELDSNDIQTTESSNKNEEFNFTMRRERKDLKGKTKNRQPVSKPVVMSENEGAHNKNESRVENAKRNRESVKEDHIQLAKESSTEAEINFVKNMESCEFKDEKLPNKNKNNLDVIRGEQPVEIQKKKAPAIAGLLFGKNKSKKKILETSVGKADINSHSFCIPESQEDKGDNIFSPKRRHRTAVEEEENQTFGKELDNIESRVSHNEDEICYKENKIPQIKIYPQGVEPPICKLNIRSTNAEVNTSTPFAKRCQTALAVNSTTPITDSEAKHDITPVCQQTCGDSLDGIVANLSFNDSQAMDEPVVNCRDESDLFRESDGEVSKSADKSANEEENQEKKAENDTEVKDDHIGDSIGLLSESQKDNFFRTMDSQDFDMSGPVRKLHDGVLSDNESILDEDEVEIQRNDDISALLSNNVAEIMNKGTIAGVNQLCSVNVGDIQGKQIARRKPTLPSKTPISSLMKKQKLETPMYQACSEELDFGFDLSRTEDRSPAKQFALGDLENLEKNGSYLAISHKGKSDTRDPVVKSQRSKNTLNTELSSVRDEQNIPEDPDEDPGEDTSKGDDTLSDSFLDRAFESYLHLSSETDESKHNDSMSRVSENVALNSIMEDEVSANILEKNCLDTFDTFGELHMTPGTEALIDGFTQGKENPQLNVQQTNKCRLSDDLFATPTTPPPRRSQRGYTTKDRKIDDKSPETFKLADSDNIKPLPTAKMSKDNLKNDTSTKTSRNMCDAGTSDGMVAVSKSLCIIDVVNDSRLFNCFEKEWGEQKIYSVALACEKAPSQQTKGGIGWRVTGQSRTPRRSQRPQEVAGLVVENSSLLIVGMAVCWGGHDAYYINLRTSQENPISCSLPTPPLSEAVPLERRIGVISEVISKGYKKNCILRVWDVKICVRLLAAAGVGVITMRAEDPRVASWMIDPGAKEQNIYNLVMNHNLESLPLLEGIGSSWGMASLGVNVNNPGSCRVRAATECVVVYHLMAALRRHLMELEMLQSFDEVEMPSVVTLACMEMSGMGFSNRECEAQKGVMQTRMTGLEKEMYSLVGHPFSLTSPDEVSQVLYCELRLPLPAGAPSALRGRGRGGRGGRGSRTSGPTNKEALEKLRHLHPLPGKILEWRRINSSLTKIVFPLQQERMHCPRLGMDRIHPSSHTFTATGRVTMHEPNLQNVPKDFDIQVAVGQVEGSSKATRAQQRALANSAIMSQLGPLLENEHEGHTVSLRHALVAQKGWVLLAADYSQLELRLLAHLASCDKLLKVLNSGEDVFKTIAAQIHTVDATDVTDEWRQQAKQICYGMIYGMGARALGEQLGIDENDAQTFMDKFKGRFPGVKQFLQVTVEDSRKRGYVLTLMGRRRYLPNISSQNVHARAQSERQAVNTAIQGSAADLVKLAMVQINEALRQAFPEAPAHLTQAMRQHQEMRGAFLVLQLHDELIYEVVSDDVIQVAQLVRSHMEGVRQLSVHLPVKIKVGPSWGCMQTLTL